MLPAISHTQRSKDQRSSITLPRLHFAKLWITQITQSSEGESLLVGDSTDLQTAPWAAACLKSSASSEQPHKWGVTVRRYWRPCKAVSRYSAVVWSEVWCQTFIQKCNDMGPTNSFHRNEWWNVECKGISFTNTPAYWKVFGVKLNGICHCQPSAALIFVNPRIHSLYVHFPHSLPWIFVRFGGGSTRMPILFGTCILLWSCKADETGRLNGFQSPAAATLPSCLTPSPFASFGSAATLSFCLNSSFAFRGSAVAAFFFMFSLFSRQQHHSLAPPPGLSGWHLSKWTVLLKASLHFSLLFSILRLVGLGHGAWETLSFWDGDAGGGLGAARFRIGIGFGFLENPTSSQRNRFRFEYPRCGNACNQFWRNYHRLSNPCPCQNSGRNDTGYLRLESWSGKELPAAGLGKAFWPGAGLEAVVWAHKSASGEAAVSPPNLVCLTATN